MDDLKRVFLLFPDQKLVNRRILIFMTQSLPLFIDDSIGEALVLNEPLKINFYFL